MQLTNREPWHLVGWRVGSQFTLSTSLNQYLETIIEGAHITVDFCYLEPSGIGPKIEVLEPLKPLASNVTLKP